MTENCRFKTNMFLAVSKVPIRTNLPAQIESALLENPNRRIVLAMLDLRQREEDSNQRLQELENTVAARGDQVETLTNMLKKSETDRAARAEQIETLANMLKESETDRAARGEQIETLTNMLKESEADRAARAEQIETLTNMIKNSKTK